MTPTTISIETMTSEQLRKTASQMGIKNAKTFKKDILMSMVLNKIKFETPIAEDSEIDSLMQQEVEEITVGDYPTEEMMETQIYNALQPKDQQVTMPKKKTSTKKGRGREKATLEGFDQKRIDAVMATEKLNKSDKFKHLAKMGLTPGQIATATGANYSFIYGVLFRAKKK